MSVRFALVVLLLFLAFCLSPDAPGRERFATIGDTIVIREPSHGQELNLRKRIDLDGTILLPELGEVAVAGYTRQELRELLARRWAPCVGNLQLEVEIESAGQTPALVIEPVPPTLAARLAGLLESLGDWLREWILNPPILIARGEPR